jgi:hypothetical protein
MTLPATELARVRLATPDDEPELVELVRRMHADPEWGLRDARGLPFPFCADKARVAIQRATQRDRSWIGIVGGPGSVEGSVCLARQDLALSDGQMLTEVWNWVQPEHRAGRTNDVLVSFSLALADMLGLSLVLATMTRERVAKARAYEKKIGKPTASLFLYTNSQLRAVA